MTAPSHASPQALGRRPPLRPRFRYAPTPSRWLHLGNGLAALIGWGLARAAGGTFVLRVEDIDLDRCRPEFEAGMLADIAWLGLDWDEGPDIGGPHGPYRQSARMGRYNALLTTILASDQGYDCHCSRGDVRAAASAPHLDAPGDAGRLLNGAAGTAEIPYPGTCRPGSGRPPLPAQPDRGGVRFGVERLGDDAVVKWVDGLLGAQREDVRTTCGDFLLGRPGQPTYQLAVVADDRAMGITDVVRGRDLLGSTARQLLLHRALATADGGPTEPRFHHHPLIVDEYGRKLSKRDDSVALRTLREAGPDPAPLVAALGRAVGLFSPAVRRAHPNDVADALAVPPRLRDGHLADFGPDALAPPW